MKLQHWAMACVSIVVVPLFVILVWQLIALAPERYCGIVKAQGVPPGKDCFDLLMKGLDIKGWVIWGTLATMAAFLLVLLVALMKTVISVVGPGGVRLTVGAHGEGPIQIDGAIDTHTDAMPGGPIHVD